MSNSKLGKIGCVDMKRVTHPVNPHSFKYLYFWINTISNCIDQTTILIFKDIKSRHYVSCALRQIQTVTMNQFIMLTTNLDILIYVPTHDPSVAVFFKHTFVNMGISTNNVSSMMLQAKIFKNLKLIQKMKNIFIKNISFVNLHWLVVQGGG